MEALNSIFEPQNFTFPHAEARMTNNPKMLGWNVAPEDMKQIPEHWLTFEEPPASVHFLLGIIYFFFMVISLVGNGLVIWVFGCSKSLRTPSNMFIINLALCDFVMMLKAPIFLWNTFHRSFEAGILGCKIFAVMGALSGIGAGMTNAAIAYDRYSTIARPLDGRLSMKKALLFVFLIWFYTVPWAIVPYMELWGRFVPEGFLTTCTFDYLSQNFDTQMFVGTIFTFSYVFPMSMIIYFYSQIVSHVVNHERALKEQAKKMNVESLRSNADTQKMSVEVRIAKTAITVCFLFVASWTPYAVVALIGAFGNQALLTPGVTMIPAVCCKFVACVDPWVYAISHPKYRLELQNKLPWLGVNEKQVETVSTSTNVTPMTESTTAT